MNKNNVNQMLASLQERAISGDVQSQYLYGTICRQSGRYAEAVRWIEMAAQQNQVNAQYDLGLMYARGTGVAQNFSMATKWLKKAAEQGHDGAQYMLAVCYNEGLGVPKDLLKAVGWLKKSAAQGNQDAIADLKDFFNIR